MSDDLILAKPLSYQTKQFGSQLLDLQLWLLGCDIRWQGGNLLKRFGFEHHPRPKSQKGSALYTLGLPQGKCLYLWAFGVYIGSSQRMGLFLKRYGFNPRLIAEPGKSWSGKDLTAPPPRISEVDQVLMKKLVIRLAGWMENYETWILQVAGLEYRQDCFQNWPRRRSKKFESLTESWSKLKRFFGGEHAPA